MAFFTSGQFSCLRAPRAHQASSSSESGVSPACLNQSTASGRPRRAPRVARTAHTYCWSARGKPSRSSPLQYERLFADRSGPDGSARRSSIPVRQPCPGRRRTGPRTSPALWRCGRSERRNGPSPPADVPQPIWPPSKGRPELRSRKRSLRSVCVSSPDFSITSASGTQPSGSGLLRSPEGLHLGERRDVLTAPTLLKRIAGHIGIVFDRARTALPGIAPIVRSYPGHAASLCATARQGPSRSAWPEKPALHRDRLPPGAAAAARSSHRYRVHDPGFFRHDGQTSPCPRQERRHERQAAPYPGTCSPSRGPGQGKRDQDNRKEDLGMTVFRYASYGLHQECHLRFFPSIC